MVDGSHTQGVLSQNGSTTNSASQNRSKKADPVTVEAPSHAIEYYPPNILGCSEGVGASLQPMNWVHQLRTDTSPVQMSGKQG